MWAKINKNKSKLFRAAQVFFSTFKNEKLISKLSYENKKEQK